MPTSQSLANKLLQPPVMDVLHKDDWSLPFSTPDRRRNKKNMLMGKLFNFKKMMLLHVESRCCSGGGLLGPILMYYTYQEINSSFVGFLSL